MNRRGFLSLLPVLAVPVLLVPKRTFFLPPAGGWHSTVYKFNPQPFQLMTDEGMVAWDGGEWTPTENYKVNDLIRFTDRQAFTTTWSAIEPQPDVYLRFIESGA
jgi:hypothetical protein